MFIRRRFGFFKNLKEKIFGSDKNREFVGKDMYGNKYFQLYDPDNFPYKREIEYIEGLHNPKMDPVWAAWLNGREMQRPSDKEVEESYGNYLKRKSIGEEFDKKDEEYMRNFRETMKKITKPKQKTYQATSWNPQEKPNKKY